MKQYRVSFFNCAGEVTDTYDFDAGAEVDMERMVRQFWGECDDKIHGFEVRDENGAIVKCLKPIRQHSTVGTAEHQKTEALATTVAPLAHSPRQRRVRWVAAGATAMLVAGGALVISHKDLVLAGVHKVATSSTSALNSILPSAPPLQSSSAVLDRPPVPSIDSAIYRSMLDGFAKYQRLMLDATASESIADNEFFDVRPRSRTRHKKRRKD